MKRLMDSIKRRISAIARHHNRNRNINHAGPTRVVFLYKSAAETLSSRSDPDRILLYVSDDVANLTGFSSEDLVSGPVSYTDLIHPEDWLNVWEHVQDAVRRNRPYQLQYRIWTANGDEKSIRENGWIDFDPSGAILVEGFLNEVKDTSQNNGIRPNKHP